ncbi:MAG: FkbM family methyltransferase [Thermoanaerobaculia bacterium]
MARRARFQERGHWDARIADVLACPDNERLPRVADAGRIDGDFQIMHNGIKVAVDGYYGNGITRMLAANCGCHEPQEEVVFEAVVKSMPVGAVMIEVGAYWGFYSLWFLREVRESRVFLVEPAVENLAVGQRNFLANSASGDFTNAYIGRETGRAADGVEIVSVDSMAAAKNLSHVNLLHADVQGFEIEMLSGARQLLEQSKVDYLFISTHGAELHSECEQILKRFGYVVLVSIGLHETYSVDGIIVACSARMQPPPFLPPSKKRLPRVAGSE